jgi:hypothetical protein
MYYYTLQRVTPQATFRDARVELSDVARSMNPGQP